MTNTAQTATKEINPDSMTNRRPMLSPRIKQAILVPRELLNKACSSGVQMLLFNIIASST
jgi:hypothetical protein